MSCKSVCTGAKHSYRTSAQGRPTTLVRPGVRKESKKSPKLRFWTLFGLRGALFGDSGAHRGRRPRDTLVDSFRLFWGSGPEGPGSPLCQASGIVTLFGHSSFLTGFPGKQHRNMCTVSTTSRSSLNLLSQFIVAKVPPFLGMTPFL